MEFKDLPTSIQEIAAHTLRHRLNELALESVTKKDTDNIARNVRDAFTGLYFCASVINTTQIVWQIKLQKRQRKTSIRNQRKKKLISLLMMLV